MSKRFVYTEWGHWHDGYNMGLKDTSCNVTYDFGDKELNNKLGTINETKYELINDLVKLLNNLHDKNEKLLYENLELRQKNPLYYENLRLKQLLEATQEEVDYLQVSIDEAINNQKTDIAKNALREVIRNYNMYMLGHRKDGVDIDD